jgi:hypothetical protein
MAMSTGVNAGLRKTIHRSTGPNGLRTGSPKGRCLLTLGLIGTVRTKRRRPQPQGRLGPRFLGCEVLRREIGEVEIGGSRTIRIRLRHLRGAHRAELGSEIMFGGLFQGVNLVAIGMRQMLEVERTGNPVLQIPVCNHRSAIERREASSNHNLRDPLD